MTKDKARLKKELEKQLEEIIKKHHLFTDNKILVTVKERKKANND